MQSETQELEKQKSLPRAVSIAAVVLLGALVWWAVETRTAAPPPPPGSEALLNQAGAK